jgi:hypothetical protein
MQCSHIKKITPEYGEFGLKFERVQCTKPEYKDGLCKRHYVLKMTKSLPWGERKEYRDVTEQEFNSGKPMLLKVRKEHVRYAYRKKQMCRWSEKQGVWIPESTIPMNYALYCVRKSVD